jgi:hypothetical protein
MVGITILGLFSIVIIEIDINKANNAKNIDIPIAI